MLQNLSPQVRKCLQHAGDCARVLAEFAGFAFEAIDFLDDFDGDQDRVFLETEQ